jgi:hypothetical protein
MVPMNLCWLNVGVPFFIMESNIKVHIIFKPIAHPIGFGIEKKLKCP